MSLVPVDTTSALAVSDYLDRARTWLATAVEMTGPVEIAAARAEIATAAEAAKQLHLSKDIREDATEMVRRAEYAVSRSIKKARENGELPTQGQGGGAKAPYVRERNGVVEQVQAPTAISGKTLPSITDIAPDYYYNGSELAALGQIEPEKFDEVLEDAKSEGNLSRANVVRKIKGQSESTPLTRQQRADLIAELAAEGYSSRQMPSKVGVTEETVRQIARDFDVEIPADKIVGRTRRLDHTQMVEHAVSTLDNVVTGINLIDFSEVDPTEAHEWATSLTESIAELRRFAKQIKEIAHV